MDWDQSDVPLATPSSCPMPINIQIPQLYQPTFPEHTERKPTEDDFKIDVITAHTVELLKYNKNLSNFLEEIDLKSKIYETSGNSKHLSSLVNTALEPPPVLRKIRKSSLFSNILSPESISDVSCNKVFLNCKTLDVRCKMKLLQRSVLLTSLIEGLTGCDQHVLDTLTDLLDNFFSTISTQFACANLATCRGGEQHPNLSLVNLQKVLVNCGVGSISDVLQFQELHFLDRNKRLFKLSESMYEDCIAKQESFRKQLVPVTDEPMDTRSTSECFSATVKDASWREGNSLKRTANSAAEESFLGIYGHVEEENEACLNPAKKPKM